MNNVLLSLVVPVYNSELTIKHCLESILNAYQPFTEIIIINDGSTDNSAEIIKSYAKKFDFFNYYEQDNHGVSYTRNRGISLSKGQWISFIDSDDYISDSFLKDFFDALNNNSFDLYFGNVQRINLDGSSFVEYTHDNCIVGIKEAIVNHNLLCTGDPHAKIFFNAIIKLHSIRFKENIKYGEDRLFIDEFILHASSIAFCNKINYYYKRNPSGLSYKFNSFESELQWFNSLVVTLHEISEKINVPFEKVRLPFVSLRVLYILSKYKSFSDYIIFFKSLGDFQRNCLDMDIKQLFGNFPFVFGGIFYSRICFVLLKIKFFIRPLK